MHPQWYIARGAVPNCVRHAATGVDGGDHGSSSTAVAREGKALYVVFRGTWSSSDIIRDLCVEPENHLHLGHFHGGFLKGVRDDPDLAYHLKRALADGCDHLFLFGHSLGGSLALTLAAARLLPDEDYRGPVTVVAVGSPPVICTERPRPPAHPQQEQEPGRPRPTSDTPTGTPAAPSPLRLSRARISKCLLVVNDCDVVPRLLGSPMPVAMAAALAASAGRGGGAAVMRRNAELMETMQRYTHPRETVGLLLRADGTAKAVPAHERSAVLHLHESLSPTLFDDHGTEQYTANLELAAALAEAFDEDVEASGDGADDSSGGDI